MKFEKVGIIQNQKWLFVGKNLKKRRPPAKVFDQRDRWMPILAGALFRKPG